MSTLESADLNFAEAMKNEFEHGIKTLTSPEFKDGVMPYLTGKGRHGKF